MLTQTAQLLTVPDDTQLDKQSRYNFSEQVISSVQNPLPKQQTQETCIHALSGILTRDPRSRKAADLHLRPQIHRDRPPKV